MNPQLSATTPTGIRNRTVTPASCATPTPQMVRVQDPFEKLLVRPFTKTQIVETVREVGGVRIAHAQVMEAGEI
jgi:hypothetical protein